MKHRRLTLASAFTVAVVPAVTALASPPHSRAARHSTPPVASTPPPPPTTRPGSPAALAYMTGKQALVGLHAPLTRAVQRDPAGRPMLTLFTVNRRETLTLASTCDEGGFASEDLDRAAHLLRSAGGEEHPVDPRTLALVYRIQTHFDVPEIHVVSGYRVPKPGSHSNHGKGRAIDLIVPGVPDADVAKFARDLGYVGVGVYPTSQFVHVDIRPRSYFWVDFSGPRMKNKESCILPEVAARGDAEASARGQAPIEPFVVSTDVDASLHARGGAAAAAPGDEEEDED